MLIKSSRPVEGTSTVENRMSQPSPEMKGRRRLAVLELNLLVHTVHVGWGRQHCQMLGDGLGVDMPDWGPQPLPSFSDAHSILGIVCFNWSSLQWDKGRPVETVIWDDFDIQLEYSSFLHRFPWLAPDPHLSQLLHVYTNQGIFRTLTQREGASVLSLPTPYLLGTLVDGPRLLWQLLCASFSTYKTCCYCINHVTVFLGQSSILGSVPSHLRATMATLPMHPIPYVY